MERNGSGGAGAPWRARWEFGRGNSYGANSWRVLGLTDGGGAE